MDHTSFLATIVLSLAANVQAAAGPDVLESRAPQSIVAIFRTFNGQTSVGKALLNLDAPFWKPVLNDSADAEWAQNRLGPLNVFIDRALARDLLQASSSAPETLTERQAVALVDHIVTAKASATKSIEEALHSRMEGVRDTAEGWEEFAKTAGFYSNYSRKTRSVYSKARKMAKELRRIAIDDALSQIPWNTTPVRSDKENLARLLRRAIIDESSEAQHTLAVLHEKGFGDVLAKDADRALQWHLNAARIEKGGRDGSAQSLFRLGEIIETEGGGRPMEFWEFPTLPVDRKRLAEAQGEVHPAEFYPMNVRRHFSAGDALSIRELKIQGPPIKSPKLLAALHHYSLYQLAAWKGHGEADLRMKVPERSIAAEELRQLQGHLTELDDAFIAWEKRTPMEKIASLAELRTSFNVPVRVIAGLMALAAGYVVLFSFILNIGSRILSPMIAMVATLAILLLFQVLFSIGSFKLQTRRIAAIIRSAMGPKTSGKP